MDGPPGIHDAVEKVRQPETRPNGGEHGHDVRQGRLLRVPDDPDGHDVGFVHECPTNLDFGAAGGGAVADVAHGAGLVQQLAEHVGVVGREARGLGDERGR